MMGAVFWMVAIPACFAVMAGVEAVWDRWIRRRDQRVWSEGASAMRAAWDVDGEIVEPTNPYAGGDGR
ncbi:hypothetical protein FYJ24_07055 [Actinomycetaceae bacterium WB03_NA08]|uniref:Uncharacterized protein n=1 Tax=Scrofimicrobium canadense TaxID=2652290 RepID=A0A6N7W8D1_9ACTO|nr:hypothetical protein [Scrofimicrobium canadense]MSS84526.1 hypothetical protein [Scrofimicrobium canadense]